MKLIHRRYLRMVALTWAGCFVLFLLIYIMLLAPQNRSLKQYEQQLAEQLRMYEAAQNASREETKSMLNRQIERLQNRLGEYVIDSEDSADLTFDIGRMANEKKVTSFSIKGEQDRTRSEIPDCNHIRESYMNVSFSAGFIQFASLLNALERHRPVVFVDSFTITRSRQGGPEHPVNMELAVFVRKRQDSRAPNAI